jgi:hypothetical protein
MKMLLRIVQPLLWLLDKIDRHLCKTWLIPSDLRVWWQELWNRKDEFHPCYNLDTWAWFSMTPQRRLRYTENLTARRNAAHRRNCHDEPLIT